MAEIHHDLESYFEDLNLLRLPKDKFPGHILPILIRQLVKNISGGKFTAKDTKVQKTQKGKGSFRIFSFCVFCTFVSFVVNFL
jgi:hypothetical protein